MVKKKRIEATKFNKKRKTAISLFAGCGGDSVGLEKAGYDVVGFVEFWKKAVETHKKNFPKCKFIGEEYGGDITKIPDDFFKEFSNKIDILFAGFPCQGFSHAGKKNPNDQRNQLFWEFVRVAKLIKPKWVIGENVSGLVHRKTDDGKSFVKDVIVSAFEEIGYNMTPPQVLKAENFGVPQKRRRVFFVGNNQGINFKFPEETHSQKPLSIRNIIEIDGENSIQIDNKFNELNSAKIISIKKKNCGKGKPHPYLKLKVSKDQYSFRRRISPHHVEIVDLDAPTKTIHCGYSFQPRLFVPVGSKKDLFLREFTSRELWRIQGFPKDYSFVGSRSDIVKQIGNAVPPKLAEVLANQITKSEKTSSS